MLEETVNFHRLGLAIVDEQHRFGVAQRAKLWQQGSIFGFVIIIFTYIYLMNRLDNKLNKEN